MKYQTLKRTFQELKRKDPNTDLTAYIIFTEDSFDEVYPVLSRTYCFTSNNKAFRPSALGRSLFASCLDGSDPHVRLDWYMSAEGNDGGWKVEECFLLEHLQDAAAIPVHTRAEQKDRSVCYFFGDTCIRVREIEDEDGRIRFEPLSGEQVISGEWIDLRLDRVHGYCTLLARYLNSMK